MPSIFEPSIFTPRIFEPSIFAPVGQSYSDLILSTSGLLGYWRLGETSGITASDSSGNGYHGTYSPNSSGAWTGGTLGQTGPIGGAANTAALFNGTTGYVTVPSGSAFAPTAQVTSECWASMADWTTPNGQYGIGPNKTQSGGFGLFRSDPINAVAGRVTWLVRRNGVYGIARAGSLLPSGWHHLAGTYDGQLTKLYIDGVIVSTDDAGAAYPIVYGTPTNNVIIGGDAGPFTTLDGFSFNGSIAHAAIYNRALTAAEIAERWARGAA